jgi:4-hydroxy-tetrahydrodipicolinate synthase
MAHLVEFLQDRGITSIAVNGATGEYIRSTVEEVQTLIQLVRQRLRSGSTLIVGAGGPDRIAVQRLLRGAKAAGADGVLLPVPSYFPYSQEDIIAFVEGLELGLPTYLYNLPSFTTPLQPETVLRICQSVPEVIGVKDSSGKLDIVSLLQQHLPSAGRIIGNDGALYAALSQDLCHGVVSGVAGVLPELMLRLFATANDNPQDEIALSCLAALKEFIGWLDRFPVPWGLKMVAEARGLGVAEFSLPLSAERTETKHRFIEWLEQNREALLIS